MGKLFEVVIFTASDKIYADPIINAIDPLGENIHYRVYRESCTVINNMYVKDLRILNRNLSETIIIDNAVESFLFQVNNGINIESWYGDDDDIELLNVLETLLTIKDVADVRDIISQVSSF